MKQKSDATADELLAAVVRRHRDIGATLAGAEASEGYDPPPKMGRAEYDKLKAALQIELLKMQSWVKTTGDRIVILFEGRDAAGKGGTIKRFMDHLNPRGATPTKVSISRSNLTSGFS